MVDLNDGQVAEFFRRSYATVDGLWFLKIEEKYGFDAALEIDNEVWKVLPKIQARMLKTISETDGGMDALAECLSVKLTLDGFKFRVEKSEGDNCFCMVIIACPWHNLMVKSGRESLSGKVGDTICNTEYAVWASEFGKDICLWGGVDTRQVMPRGTTKDVRDEVALRIEQMGPGGGYVLAAVHNLQPEVPAANIVELFHAGRQLGKYPLV